MALHVRGVLLPDDEVRDLWLVGDRVTFTPVPGAETVVDGGFVLPGLVDAHCHIGIARGGAPITSLDQARALAHVDRDAGVLAIRDAGSPYPYPELDDEPDLPRLARAGQHVAPPKRYLRDIGVEVDATEVAATVAAQARAGNGWVKLVGDWIDRGVGDLAPAWDEDTLTAAVRAAHDAGVRAAVHTFSESAVEIMVRAGVDSVEHGTGLSLDLIDEMARQGTALVPTMINIATFGGIAEQARGKFPGYADHMLALRDGFPEVVRAAHEAGVPIYVGTDAGGGIDHGLAAEEMLLLHERAGMAPVDVLAAASWGARAWLGFAGLVEGGLADLTVYPEDPRSDLRVVRAPSRTILRGRVIR
ncbi:Tryptophan 2-monooxygenase [Micromonospora saelicesensis]|uniref:amidohydrolase family protein n=1 Tax=Micromonospora saelicesensis TaxID=285676 RepID=UPI000DC3E749|nr:amidohydrolase family protein [Micromonospora saelicesensis]RAO42253.1 Tryptophan 2-monooxygenase [Micromonospora saelicesensis]RAO51245.1 Tryptophan 2-monooxygenase [Micromonospora saelicesensis]